MNMLPPWTPENVTFFSINDRKEDYMYDIESTRKYVFEFLIPIDGENQITCVCSDLGSQDLSLSMWFSVLPLGDMLFYNIDPYIAPYGVPKMYMFDNVRFPTPNNSISIYDGCSEKFQEKYLKLPPGKYYLNIENKQQRRNQFRLTFTDEGGMNLPDSQNQKIGPVHDPNLENSEYNDLGETCETCHYGISKKWNRRVLPCKSCGRPGGKASMMMLR